MADPRERLISTREEPCCVPIVAQYYLYSVVNSIPLSIIIHTSCSVSVQRGFARGLQLHLLSKSRTSQVIHTYNICNQINIWDLLCGIKLYIVQYSCITIYPIDDQDDQDDQVRMYILYTLYVI